MAKNFPDQILFWKTSVCLTSSSHVMQQKDHVFCEVAQQGGSQQGVMVEADGSWRQSIVVGLPPSQNSTFKDKLSNEQNGQTKCGCDRRKCTCDQNLLEHFQSFT
jgi:hypothetical protein